MYGVHMHSTLLGANQTHYLCCLNIKCPRKLLSMLTIFVITGYWEIHLPV